MEETRKETMMNRAVSDMQGSNGNDGVFAEFEDVLSKQGKDKQKFNDEAGEASGKIEARRTVFANQINNINRGVMGSEVRSSHLIRPSPNEVTHMLYSLQFTDSTYSSTNTNSAKLGGGVEDPDEKDLSVDNGISVLTAADYCQCRLVPLINYYEQRSPILSRRLGLFTTVMVLLTAITTGLSLVSHLKMWVPLVVAFGAAIATTLEWCVRRDEGVLLISFYSSVRYFDSKHVVIRSIMFTAFVSRYQGATSKPPS